MDADVVDENHRVLRIVGLEGDAAQEADFVERDSLTGENEDEGEEHGLGVAVVEGVKEADVEIGTGGQSQRPTGVG